LLLEPFNVSQKFFIAVIDIIITIIKDQYDSNAIQVLHELIFGLTVFLKLWFMLYMKFQEVQALLILRTINCHMPLIGIISLPEINGYILN